MNYTVNKLATLSGVTIRTLRFYDEIGLLKPAYIAENGYRYYQEKELLLLQQILFFRELGFSLKHIQEILKQDDFDKLEALKSHKKILNKNISRLAELMTTVDKTISYLQGKQTMKPNEIFKGFSPEEQAKHEEYLLKRYGAKMKSSLAEAEKKTKNWKNDDWQRTKLEFDAICKDLVHVLKEQADPSSPEVQVIIQRHYDWLKQFWTPNRESYAGHADLILESELRKAYEAYDQELPEFVAKSIKIFAERQLK